MPHLSYDEKSMPTPEEFRKDLREMAEQYDPVGDLLYVHRKLVLLEEKYGVSSEEFYRLFYEGKTGDGDEVDMIGWVSYYREFKSLKTAISEVVDRVSSEPQAV